MISRSITCLIVLLLQSASTTAPSRSVWDGVYTKEQVARGKTAYNSLCARCHGENFLGGEDATALVGKDFLAKWDGKSVGALVELTRKEMPSDGPGKLTRKQCTDITAYVLSANEFPTGPSELAPELPALEAIQIRVKK